MNYITIIGNLTADPSYATVKTANGNVSKTTFTVAVARTMQKDKTDFFPVTTWRGLAENCDKYLAKGKKVAVIGEMQDNVVDKDGTKVHYWGLVASEVEFLSPRSEEVQNRPKGLEKAEEIEDDSLPF